MKIIKFISRCFQTQWEQIQNIYSSIVHMPSNAILHLWANVYANLVLHGNCDDWIEPENACSMFVVIGLQIVGVMYGSRGFSIKR